MTDPQEKRRLRTAMKKKLASMHGVAAHAAGERVAARVLDLPEVATAGGVLVCRSFGVEVPTHGLIEALFAAGKRVYLPRVQSGARPRAAMTLHPYPCALERLRFGLEQPDSRSDSLPDGEIEDRVDAALILGLAFDVDGFRLGYGGGYFDRFLARHRVVSVGLAFDAQRVQALPRESHDVPMGCVVTESGVWRPLAVKAL